MNDETAELIFVLSGLFFGALAGVVTAKVLIRELKGVRFS